MKGSYGASASSSDSPARVAVLRAVACAVPRAVACAVACAEGPASDCA
ncbi:hypothetical protein [Rothia nasimurium]|nr:hypothetical protein [Rothia nasimurium]